MNALLPYIEGTWVSSLYSLRLTFQPNFNNFIPNSKTLNPIAHSIDAIHTLTPEVP